MILALHSPPSLWHFEPSLFLRCDVEKKEKGSQTDRQRQTDRHTDRLRDRQTEMDRQRQTDRQRDRLRDRQIDRQTD